MSEPATAVTVRFPSRHRRRLGLGRGDLSGHGAASAARAPKGRGELVDVGRRRAFWPCSRNWPCLVQRDAVQATGVNAPSRRLL